jgi:hypothetical protein
VTGLAIRLGGAGWRVTYDELAPRGLGPGVPTVAQVAQLWEDLLQAVDGDGRILDVGWYPAMDPEGCFVVLLVEEGRWDEPRVRREAATYEELEAVVADLAVLPDR